MNAADGDGEPGLALALEPRHRQIQEAAQEVEELLGDRLAHDVVTHCRRQAGEMTKLVDVIGVLHESDVENEVRLQGHAVLEAEADQLEDQPLLRSRVRQVGEDPLLELAERQVRGVDDDVRVGPNGLETTAFLGDRTGDPTTTRERVAVTRLRETTNQDVVASLEEDDPRLDASALESPAHRGQRERRIARPDVQDDRDLLEPAAIGRNEFREIGQELARHVVHAGVAEVLKQLGRGGLAGSGEAAEDHHALLVLVALFGGSRPGHDVAARGGRLALVAAGARLSGGAPVARRTRSNANLAGRSGGG